MKNVIVAIALVFGVVAGAEAAEQKYVKVAGGTANSYIGVNTARVTGGALASNKVVGTIEVSAITRVAQGAAVVSPVAVVVGVAATAVTVGQVSYYAGKGVAMAVEAKRKAATDVNYARKVLEFNSNLRGALQKTFFFWK